MKKQISSVAACIFASILINVAAAAADLGVPRSDYIAITPYNWNGLYVGGSFGAVWGRTQFTSAVIPSAAIPDARTIGVIDSLGTGMRIGNHLTGGLQLGFNWQIAPGWLIGVETDINSIGQKLVLDGTGSAPATRAAPPALGAAPAIAITNSLSASWLATVRARLGTTFNNLNSVLVYLTGGVAFTAISNSQEFSVNFSNVADYSVTQSQGTSSGHNTKVGWTVGVGTEWAITRAWSARFEYLFTQFAGQNTSTTICSTGLGCVQNLFGSTDPFRVQIARFGANYRFGDGPIIAVY